MGRREGGRLGIFAATALMLGVPGVLGTATAQFQPADPPYQSGFPVAVSGNQITSAIALGDVNGDGVLDIVAGGLDGRVYAYAGTGTKLWEYDTQGAAITGQPAIADVDGDGLAEVIVTGGSTLTSAPGGVWVLSHAGALQCRFDPLDVSGDGDPDGVYSSPAVADLDGDDGGRLEIAFGSWDMRIRAIHHDCTTLWDRHQLPPTGEASYFFDTVWSSPAIADVDGNGRLDVVIGVDSPDASPNVVPVGGAVHVFDGRNGTELAGFPVTIDETVWSSPALADLTGNGRYDIVVGTGNCWEVPACAPLPAGVQEVDEAIFAWDHAGVPLPGWPVDLSGTGNDMQGTFAFASPALADLDHDGELEVVLNTMERTDNQGGQVYVFDADGSVLPGWPTRPVVPASPTATVSMQTGASPVVADVTGDGDLEVLLPSNWDLVIFDRNGTQLSRDTFPTEEGDFRLSTQGPLGASAAVGDVDGDGDLEVVAGGYAVLGPPAVGGIYVWDFDAPAESATPWPMFRRSADNRASTDVPPRLPDGYVEPIGSCGGAEPCFSTLQAAIDGASDDHLLHVSEGDYDEVVVVGRPDLQPVLLQPGWNDDFTARGQPALTIAPGSLPGETSIRGLTISGGVLRLG